MEQKKDTTEEKILSAAHEVFIHKGMDGARMQEIADHAGINKALLHYYFRTKEKLFQAIFSKAFTYAFPKIQAFIASDIPFTQKIETFVDAYVDLLLNNPYLPGFILKEINRDPEMLAGLLFKQGINPSELFNLIQKEMDEGGIIKMNPRHLMVNIIAMSVFPFAAKPLLMIVMFNNDKKAYKVFLEERKEVIKKFVINAITEK